MEAVIENGKVVNIIVGHIQNSLPLEDIKPTILDTQKIDGFTYDIQTDKVVKVYTIIDKPIGVLKKQKINSITLDANAPVVVNGVTFNGGGSSASAISGAVALATALGETDVRLWDIDNVIHAYTFDEANAIAAQIAQTYRDIQLQKYALIEQINAVVVDGTINVTEADAIAELDAIVI